EHHRPGPGTRNPGPAGRLRLELRAARPVVPVAALRADGPLPAGDEHLPAHLLALHQPVRLHPGDQPDLRRVRQLRRAALRPGLLAQGRGDAPDHRRRRRHRARAGPPLRDDAESPAAGNRRPAVDHLPANDALAAGRRLLLELHARRFVRRHQSPALVRWRAGAAVDHRPDPGQGVDRPGRDLDVDALRDLDPAGGSPERAAGALRGGDARPRLGLDAVPADHPAVPEDPDLAGAAVPHHRHLQDLRRPLHRHQGRPRRRNRNARFFRLPGRVPVLGDRPWRRRRLADRDRHQRAGDDPDQDADPAARPGPACARRGGCRRM
ncbi:MAG: hypothetical protein AVDCRST_MAG59-525, partial [uncultured Thermomicrobiales bacterium]